eukprot:TRINITY_DN1902_c0_g1_i7.p2 TRINITY_DN1902_c0_g1~~TRINITY_DN1902_c0_g1_i7.p2  ORF type:complete len:206 (+),score=17.73 TRINITY_DN1902_c0_g1_i7:200-817(+)
MKFTQYWLIFIFLGVCLTENICYNTCDPRWAVALYGESGLCENPGGKQRIDLRARFLNALASAIASLGHPCFGVKPCTPLELTRLTNIYDPVTLSIQLDLEIELERDMTVVGKKMSDSVKAVLIPRAVGGGARMATFPTNQYFYQCQNQSGNQAISLDSVQLAILIQKPTQSARDKLQEFYSVIFYRYNCMYLGTQCMKLSLIHI